MKGAGRGRRRGRGRISCLCSCKELALAAAKTRNGLRLQGCCEGQQRLKLWQRSGLPASCMHTIFAFPSLAAAWHLGHLLSSFSLATPHQGFHPCV